LQQLHVNILLNIPLVPTLAFSELITGKQEYVRVITQVNDKMY